MASDPDGHGSPRLALLGLLVALGGGLMAGRSYIAVDLGDFHRTITRHRDPLIYWGVVSAVFACGIALMVLARRARRRR